MKYIFLYLKYLEDNHMNRFLLKLWSLAPDPKTGASLELEPPSVFRKARRISGYINHQGVS